MQVCDVTQSNTGFGCNVTCSLPSNTPLRLLFLLFFFFLFVFRLLAGDVSYDALCTPRPSSTHILARLFSCILMGFQLGPKTMFKHINKHHRKWLSSLSCSYHSIWSDTLTQRHRSSPYYRPSIRRKLNLHQLRGQLS